MKQVQHLYFLLNPYTGLIKIGIAQNIAGRMADLACACGVHLRLLASLESGARYEKELHEAFHDSRTVGEWFVPSEALLALVDAPASVPDFLRAAQPKILAFRAAQVDAKAERQRVLAEEKRELLEAQREAARKKKEAEARREAARQARLAAKADRERAEHEAAMAVWKERNADTIAARCLTANDLPAVEARTEMVMARQRDRNALLIGVEPLA
jgi:hypothetical protein